MRLEEAIFSGQSRGEIAVDATAKELSHFIVSIMEGGLMLARVSKKIIPISDSLRSIMIVLRPRHMK